MECLHKYNMYKNKSTINKKECKVLHQNNMLWSVKWYTIWHINKSQWMDSHRISIFIVSPLKP